MQERYGSDYIQHIYHFTCSAHNQLMYLGFTSLLLLTHGIGQKKKKKIVETTMEFVECLYCGEDFMNKYTNGY